VVGLSSSVSGHNLHLGPRAGWSLEGNWEDLSTLSAAPSLCQGLDGSPSWTNSWGTISQQEDTLDSSVLHGKLETSVDVGATSGSQTSNPSLGGGLVGGTGDDNTRLPLVGTWVVLDQVEGLGVGQTNKGIIKSLLDVSQTGESLSGGLEGEGGSHGTRNINNEVHSVNTSETGEDTGWWGVSLDSLEWCALAVTSSTSLGNDPLSIGSTFWSCSSWAVSVGALDVAHSSLGLDTVGVVATWGLWNGLGVALWNWFGFFLDAGLDVPLSLGAFGVSTGVETWTASKLAGISVLGSAAAPALGVTWQWWFALATSILADGGVDPLSVGAHCWSTGLSFTWGALDGALGSSHGGLLFVGASVSDGNTSESWGGIVDGSVNTWWISPALWVDVGAGPLSIVCLQGLVTGLVW